MSHSYDWQVEIPAPVEHAILKTYRGLRLGMVVLVVFLGAAILLARLSATCLEATVSDYYFTTAHTSFIGAICALGTCLIAYQGSSAAEDALLNFAGFLAFVVALVPTARPTLCGPGLPVHYSPAVGDNVTALLVAGVMALAISLAVRSGSKRGEGKQEKADARCAGRWYQVQKWLPRVLLALLLAGTAAFFIDRAQFTRHAHRWAAVAMFAAIICVVLLNALYASQTVDRSRRRRIGITVAYIMIAAIMLIALVAAVIVEAAYGPEWKQGGVFVLESVLLSCFVLYWVVQTADLWAVPDYRCVLPPTTSAAID